MDDKASVPMTGQLQQHPRHHVIAANLFALTICSVIILVMLAVLAAVIFACCQGVPELLFGAPLAAVWALMAGFVGIDLLPGMKDCAQDLAVAACQHYHAQS